MLCVSNLKLRFQPVHMHFGIIEQLQCHEKIGNNKFICLKMLVLAVYIPVLMYAKWQGCEWNIFVLKNSLKIGFEFRFQTVNTSCWAKFGITENTSCLKFFVIAVWIPIYVFVKYLSIWVNIYETPAVWNWDI